MRALKALAGLVVVLFLSGCLVETEQALADPDPNAMDQRLVGSWYHSEKGEVSVLTIIPDPEKPNTYRAIFAGIKPGAAKPAEYVEYRVWVTRVKDQPYLNVRRVGGNAVEQPGFTIMAYDLGADGSLKVRLMATKPVIAAIEAGKLKGRVKKGEYSSDVTLTSPGADIAAFIAGANRDELFPPGTSAMRKLAETPN
jgi:hypothetical protein